MEGTIQQDLEPKKKSVLFWGYHASRRDGGKEEREMMI